MLNRPKRSMIHYLDGPTRTVCIAKVIVRFIPMSMKWFSPWWMKSVKYLRRVLSMQAWMKSFTLEMRNVLLKGFDVVSCLEEAISQPWVSFVKMYDKIETLTMD